MWQTIKEWLLKLSFPWKILLSLGIAVLVIGSLMLATLRGDEASAYFNDLTTHAQMTKEGNLEVKEHVNIALNRKSGEHGKPAPWRQLYRRYIVNASQLTGLSNISVTNSITGKQYKQDKSQECLMTSTRQSLSDGEWNEQCSGKWYVAEIDGDFLLPIDQNAQYISPYGQDDKKMVVELGWNIPSVTESDNQEFDVNVTLNNIATHYDDVTKFQWAVLADENKMSVKNLHATLQLPAGATSKNSQEWLHTSHTSRLEFNDDGNVIQLDTTNVNSDTHIDIVSMVDSAVMPGVLRKVFTDQRANIIADEQQQMERARESQEREDNPWIWISISLVGIALACITALRYWILRKRNRYQGDIEYWRESPDVSPGVAALVYASIHGESGN